jgi:C-terminal processing protease CtpA/Prc
MTLYQGTYMKGKLFSLVFVAFVLLVACQNDATSPENESDNLQESSVTTTTKVATITPTKTPQAEPTAVPPTPEPSPEPQESTSRFPSAEIVNDEGGTVSITGDVEYTNAFFTMGVAEPVVILEDQAGFVDRNENFLMPLESQTLGQITSDFFTSPFSYSIALPQEPQGTLRDVDNDDETNQGVQVYAIAYWTNTFGDPYLEERDLSGGGWSTAYASTLISDDAETKREIVGGKLLLHAPDANQGFPSGFGDDGLLFTEDDPIVGLPQGYTVVDLDTDPFTFDRSNHPVIDLIEPESTALVDYSDLGYAEAFDALVEKLRKEYAFTEYKGLDWDQIHASLRPQFDSADEKQDPQLYLRALRDFARSIPDGHVSGPFLADEFVQETRGGLGIAVRELDDGRIIVNFLGAGTPADEAGIELGAEILQIDGQPFAEKASETVPHSAPFSTDHLRRLQQLRYATRFPEGTEVTITFRNPENNSSETVTITAVPEPASFRFSSLNAGQDGFELPVEYELLPASGYAYAKINSFSDNELLTIQLWERMLRTLNDRDVAGLIIDMRQNGGGSGFLADQMAAYFYNEPLVLGNKGEYDKELDDFYFDPRGEERFYLPAEELRYDGAVALLIGPNCHSACEFFSYDMTLQDRAAILGQYPTAGAGGGIDRIKMPEDEFFTYTKSRAVDPDGQIHIEGKGVPPTVQVPVTEEILLGDEDAVLEAAISYLNNALTPEVVEGGEISLADPQSGQMPKDTAIEYILKVSAGNTINIIATSDDFDPGVLIFDDDRNLLLANEYLSDDKTDAGFEELEIPEDMTLLIWVTSLEEGGEGAFTLSVESTGS